MATHPTEERREGACLAPRAGSGNEPLWTIADRVGGFGRPAVAQLLSPNSDAEHTFGPSLRVLNRQNTAEAPR